MILLLNFISSNVTLPVPFALNSKSLLDKVVVIKLSSIKISPVLKLFAVTLPKASKLSAFNTPCTVRSFSITTLLLGIIIVPVPLASSSKSLLDICF